MPVLGVSEYDAHAFAVRVELHAAEHFKLYVFDDLPLSDRAVLPRLCRFLVPNAGLTVIASVEFESMLLRKFNQSYLVWRWTLVEDFCTGRRLLGLRHALVRCTQKFQEFDHKRLLVLQPESYLA